VAGSQRFDPCLHVVLQMTGKRTRSFKCAVHQRDREVCSENDFHILVQEPPVFRRWVCLVRPTAGRGCCVSQETRGDVRAQAGPSPTGQGSRLATGICGAAVPDGWPNAPPCVPTGAFGPARGLPPRAQLQVPGIACTKQT
jgi:hypothetical protein